MFAIAFVLVLGFVSWGSFGPSSSVLLFPLLRLSSRLGSGDDLDESAETRAVLRHLGSHGVQRRVVALDFEVDLEMAETGGVSSRGGVDATRVVGGDGGFHRGCALRAGFDAKALESRAASLVLGVRGGGRGRVVAAFAEGGATGVAAGVAAGAVSAAAGALALWVGGATPGRIVVLRGARGDDARLDPGQEHRARRAHRARRFDLARNARWR